MDIIKIVNDYGLPEAESSALKSLLYGFKEGRFKVSEINAAARTRLVNSICCGTSGMQELDSRLQTVLEYFRRFNHENHNWRNDA